MRRIMTCEVIDRDLRDENTAYKPMAQGGSRMYLTGIRSFVGAALIAGAVCFYAAYGAVSVAAKEARHTASAGVAEDVAAVQQLGRTMGDAMVALDMDALDRIYADDWASVSQSGHMMTKHDVMESIRSGDHRLLWYELGPIDVQVVGDLAVAHGTVKERRLRDGKQVYMEGVYMDFLKKRDGRWVVVRSAGGMLEPKT
jgi:ketosteroid isomerase-like protein